MKTLDLRIGEAKIVGDVAKQIFDLSASLSLKDNDDFIYQPKGYPPLLKELEQKYNAPVLITNGAIQGLHAVMYALRKKKLKKMGIRVPYWNRIPQIAKYNGVKPIIYNGKILSDENLGIDSYFLTLPNNPDGFVPGLDSLRAAKALLKEHDIPLIHDAAYYTKTYMPDGYPLAPIGDVQIFSVSKMYGLSSLRLGYVVVYDPSFYQLMLEYLELSTVGVSIASQQFLLSILEQEKEETVARIFQEESRRKVKEVRGEFNRVYAHVIEFPADYFSSCSVFAWVKPFASDTFEKNKIQVLDGKMFGRPGFVRINLAAGFEIIQEAVKRLNAD